MEFVNIIFDLAKDDLHINAVGNAVEALLAPVVLDHGHEAPNRNRDYYEVIIPNYTLDDFYVHFRMSRDTFQELLRNLRGVYPNVDDSPIDYEKKVLFTIWMLAKQESFLAVGDRFNFAKSTGHLIFFEVVSQIAALRQELIVWPNDHDRVVISRSFQERSGIPGIIGAVDGCHIPIKAPPGNAIDYYNRNNYHSVILQATCNHKKEFIDIYVGAPGRLHDARVFRMSPLYTLLSGQNPPVSENEHLLGDAAYPLSAFLLKPYRDNGHLTEEQSRFNTHMSSARAIIEQSFALFTGKFRRLKYLDMSRMDMVPTVITAACVLHNFILKNDGEVMDDLNIHNEAPNLIPNEDDHEEALGRAHNIGVRKRDYIASIL